MTRNHKKVIGRTLLVAALVGCGFFCGFNADVLNELPRIPLIATMHRLEVSPLVLADRLSRPRTAFGANPAASNDEESLTPTETYLAVLNTIRADYAPQKGKIERPDAVRLTYAAIDGMLDTLNDRYTEFWTPKEYADNMQETSGVFAGIGARLDITRDKKIVVIEPIENSPAAKKGILAGDIITHVEGHVITGQTVDTVIEKIKGEPGSTIHLTLVRKGHPLPINFTLTRAMVEEPIVEWRMEDEAQKIGYVSLAMFNENADTQFASAVAKLEKRGMKALIFDLRDNPGGLLNVAQDLASRFVKAGPIVWIQEKSGKMSSLNAESNKHKGRLFTGAYPVIVLVNGNSASASEIVSGAIKDHTVGKLVGTRTFGKGLVQTIIPLADDSAVKITTQHYFTPNKTDINKKYDPKTGARISGGIIPDVSIEMTDKDFERMRDARRNNPQDRLAVDRADPQLQKAVTLLRDQMK